MNHWLLLAGLVTFHPRDVSVEEERDHTLYRPNPQRDKIEFFISNLPVGVEIDSLTISKKLDLSESLAREALRLRYEDGEFSCESRKHPASDGKLRWTKFYTKLECPND